MLPQCVHFAARAVKFSIDELLETLQRFTAHTAGQVLASARNWAREGPEYSRRAVSALRAAAEEKLRTSVGRRLRVRADGTVLVSSRSSADIQHVVDARAGLRPALASTEDIYIVHMSTAQKK